ncbi:DNA-3-methyladenine glycosylase [Synechococcus sp. PCC 7335]|uniref:DNA-3-methyladenine glycosylase family protein n=1 Tax=Synechococcus sp. (strain ATCC 29403 / PCC 7335) TaxID=91464 RepID=UPI00030A299B|nr:DNA-3-methyladenine glycosylase [Synechococcus sp. PCC 7335]
MPLEEIKDIHHQLLMVASTLSPELSFAIQQNGLLELVAKQDRPFVEQLCRTVVGQQLSLKAAASIWARLVASVPADVNFVDYLVRVDPAVLRGCGLSGAKVRTVVAIAQAARANQLDAKELGALNHTERTKRLTVLWGVGQWTADMMGIFYFADANIWPDGDVTAKKTLERLTSKRRKTIRTAVRFAPYRSYLALHMWRYVDAVPD